MNYNFKEEFPIELRKKVKDSIETGRKLLILVGIIFIILIIFKY